MLAPIAPGRDGVLAEARKRPFKPEDLTPAPPTTTDPFHNNISLFVPKVPTGPGGTQLKSKLPAYAIEELKLVAIVVSPSDSGANRAMFVDSSGMGTSVVRGERLGKSAALVSRILSDRVLFEFTEEYAPGKKRAVIRSVELYPTDTKGTRGTR
jgi:Tfp pilus assembly protein PilP